MNKREERYFYLDIGARITKRRVKVGLSQERLAKHIKLTRTSVSNIEAGRQRILIHKLDEIATALDISTGYLVMGR